MLLRRAHAICAWRKESVPNAPWPEPKPWKGSSKDWLTQHDTTKYDKMPSRSKHCTISRIPHKVWICHGWGPHTTTGPGSSKSNFCKDKKNNCCTSPGASVSITCYWGLQLEVNIAVGIVRVKDLAGAHQSPLVPLCSMQVAAKNVHCPSLPCMHKAASSWV